jgi:dihydropteroate synthase
MILRARQFVFQFPRPAIVMGILNVTPDSFSDGGRYLDTDKAIAHALDLVSQGAEILDIGGESTRPGAPLVGEAEELSRVVPVIERLVQHVRIPISVDTCKPSVAREALAAGASLINDVGANRKDETMWRIVRDADAGYICMHMQGTPLSMQSNPQYEDVMQEVKTFFEDRLERLAASGLGLDHVALDPGIGFGKTLRHNLQLLGEMRSFTTFGRPVVLGVSRKSFLGSIVPAEVSERLPGSIACATLAVTDGVQIVRAHDVLETVQALRVAEAIINTRSSAKPNDR